MKMDGFTAFSVPNGKIRMLTEGDTSMATASGGIARTKNLTDWERLPDFISHHGQQRNLVLHPEFVNGKYAFYSRPQDGFIEVGGGGGIGWALMRRHHPC